MACRRRADASQLTTEVLQARLARLWRCLNVFMLEGKDVAEEVWKRLVESSGGGWEIARVTASSFLAVGDEEETVERLVEVGCLSVGRALVRLQR